ncbi:MAG: ATP synthase subunit I [Planctomycetia bacterium]|nr:ATP synthase subunit I [Planctomycetia bacterium]
MTRGILFFMVPFVVGMALGILNYAGLWCTAQNLSAIKRPMLLILVSFVVRMGITLFAFYLVMDGRWEKLVACTVGFFLVRHTLVRRLRPEKHI